MMFRAAGRRVQKPAPHLIAAVNTSVHTAADVTGFTATLLPCQALWEKITEEP